MESRTSFVRRNDAVMRDASFGRVGGLCAILAGASGFLYAVSFLVLARQSPDSGRFWSAVLLMRGGLFATGGLTALHERLRTVNEPGALWALLLGVAGVTGAAVHGGYDLAAAVYPVQPAGSADVPRQVDPRGLLTFAVTGLALRVTLRRRAA